MSFTVNASVEELAKLFHHYQEALAGDFDCQSSDEGSRSWERTPTNERNLRVAAVRMALLELTEMQEAPNREYFAKPGEAEWGC